MALARRGVEPDPLAASHQAEFRARLRDLLSWAGYTSLQQLEAGAARRGTSMPVSTAHRALSNDRLPTAEFVERVAVACAADVKRWSAARDALADRPYLRHGTCAEAVPDAGGVPGYDYEPPCSRTVEVDRGGENGGRQPESTLLVAKHSDKCVTIKGGVTVPVAPASQITCTRTVGAEWNLQNRVVPRPDGGAVYHIRNASTGMCLDSLKSERRVGGASMVVQRPCVDDAASQLWRFDAIGGHADVTDGRFTDGRFINTAHGDCLNVNGSSLTDGAPVVRWSCGHDSNEIFRVATAALNR